MSLKCTENVIRRIDWDKLRAQKQWLIRMHLPQADGLVHLLDALQDAAHDDQLATESQIFGLTYLDKE